jgi:hypothetical protein
LLLWESVVVGDWSVIHERMGKVAIHVVVDTTAEAPGDRARLFSNGDLVAPSPAQAIPQDAMLELDPGSLFVVGSAVSSVRGSLYYLALYDGALSSERVADHADALASSDDRPGL